MNNKVLSFKGTQVSTTYNPAYRDIIPQKYMETIITPTTAMQDVQTVGTVVFALNNTSKVDVSTISNDTGDCLMVGGKKVVILQDNILSNKAQIAIIEPPEENKDKLSQKSSIVNVNLNQPKDQYETTLKYWFSIIKKAIETKFERLT